LQNRKKSIYPINERRLDAPSLPLGPFRPIALNRAKNQGEWRAVGFLRQHSLLCVQINCPPGCPTRGSFKLSKRFADSVVALVIHQAMRITYAPNKATCHVATPYIRARKTGTRPVKTPNKERTAFLTIPQKLAARLLPLPPGVTPAQLALIIADVGRLAVAFHTVAR